MDLGPNSFRCYDPSKGDFLNNHCPNCNKQTWASEREMQSLYNGKRYIHGVTGKVVGVFTFEGLIFCEPCYHELYERHDL